MESPHIKVFSTCPQSSDCRSGFYVELVAQAAQWSEANGCEGILIYTDNRIVDPWLVAEIILQKTARLAPLVAVQPVYMHPYSVARMVASLGYLFGRRVYLNMVAGGFSGDLASLDDSEVHDRRYDRLVEYTQVVMGLLSARAPFSFNGEFYRIRNANPGPELPDHLLPGVMMSGSSAASLAAAEKLGATAIKYPKATSEEAGVMSSSGIDSGIRTGIIARETEDAAWQVALDRFPEDRKGQLTHQLAMKSSDSVWHKQLSELSNSGNADRPSYWLGPFQNYKTFCPYLVGSCETVADEIARYIHLGYQTFILDIPHDEQDLRFARDVFERAEAQVAV